MTGRLSGVEHPSDVVGDVNMNPDALDVDYLRRGGEAGAGTGRGSRIALRHCQLTGQLGVFGTDLGRQILLQFAQGPGLGQVPLETLLRRCYEIVLSRLSTF